jgi:hypothetical protein
MLRTTTTTAVGGFGLKNLLIHLNFGLDRAIHSYCFIKSNLIIS